MAARARRSSAQVVSCHPRRLCLPQPPTIARVGESNCEPAMTLIPNVPATGMVAVAAALAVGVWSVVSIPAQPEVPQRRAHRGLGPRDGGRIHRTDDRGHRSPRRRRQTDDLLLVAVQGSRAVRRVPRGRRRSTSGPARQRRCESRPQNVPAGDRRGDEQSTLRRAHARAADRDLPRPSPRRDRRRTVGRATQGAQEGPATQRPRRRAAARRPGPRCRQRDAVGAAAQPLVAQRAAHP